MSNTKRFEATVRLDSGLLIPASAGTGKVLTSDSSGNGTWTVLPTKRITVPRAWVFEGALKVGTIEGPSIELGAGEKQFLIGVRYWIAEGTSATFEILKAPKETFTAVEGLTAIAAEKPGAEGGGRKSSTSEEELANGTRFRLKITAISGAPKGGTIALLIAHVA